MAINVQAHISPKEYEFNVDTEPQGELQLLYCVRKGMGV